MITGLAKIFYDVKQCNKNIVIGQPKNKTTRVLGWQTILIGRGGGGGGRVGF